MTEQTFYTPGNKSVKATYTSGYIQEMEEERRRIRTGFQNVSDAISSIIGGASLTKYLVGQDYTDPYSTISSAVAAAVADGHTAANPAVVLVKPYNYSEAVLDLYPGIHIGSTSGRSSGMVRFSGVIRMNSTSGTIDENVSSISGMTITGPGTAPAIDFIGTSPQVLYVYDSVVSSPGASPAVLVNNSGAGSSFHFNNVQASNTSTGYAASVLDGDFMGDDGVFSVSPITAIAIFANNTGSIWLQNLSVTGRVSLNGTSVATIRNTVINTGAVDEIISNTTGEVIIFNIASFVNGMIRITGTSADDVKNFSHAKYIPYDNSVSGIPANDVNEAINKTYEDITDPPTINGGSFV